MNNTIYNDLRIKEFNNGTLFAVVDSNYKWTPYYKTRKGAERAFSKLKVTLGMA